VESLKVVYGRPGPVRPCRAWRPRCEAVTA
jgi:hypothetical protein